MDVKRVLPILLFFTVVLVEIIADEHPAAPDRPNILWITSEDNGTFLGCYGDKHASTPNLDGLAQQGVRYTRCFANAPVCAVVRSSWILGVPAVTTGTHQMRSRYRVPQRLVPYPTLLKQAGYYVSNNSKTDYNTSSFEKEIWDECGNKAHYTNRAPGQPFFAVFNVKASHEGQIFESLYPEKYPAAKTPAAGIEIPPYQVETPETLRDWQRMYDRIADMDGQVGQRLTELKELGEAEDTIILYCSDHAGITLRSKRFLHDSGTRVPMIVYVPDKWKHLAPGKPGSVSDRLVQFIDMPRTMLSLSGAEVPDRMTGRIFMGAAIEPAPETVFLFSGRFDESPDMSRGITDGRWKYIRNYEPDRPRFQMLSYPWKQSGQVSQWREYQAGRTTPAQAAQYLPQPPEELYDARSDPHEVRNLVSTKRHAGRLAKMRRQLDQHLLDARDTGFIPEPMMADIDEDQSTSIYDYGQSKDKYPLPAILEVANMAQAQDTAMIPELSKRLGHNHPVIRYWAVLGLRALGKEAEPARAGIEGALKDPEASVRINAAITLGNLGERNQAMRLLLQEARSAATDAQANWALDGLKYLDAPEAIRRVPKNQVVNGAYSRRSYEQLAAGGSMNRPAAE